MNILLKSLTFQGHCENFQNKKLNVMSLRDFDLDKFTMTTFWRGSNIDIIEWTDLYIPESFPS